MTIRSGLFLLLMLGAAISAGSQAERGVAGKWVWKGSGGWQRFILDLRTDGRKLTGTLSMGPGDVKADSGRDELWELFFDPVIFSVENGRVDGNSLTFEQVVVRSGARTVLGAPPQYRDKLVYTGEVSGDQMTLTRDHTPSRQDPWILGTHRVQLVLTRVPK